MTDAKATICYLNGISLRTINEVEKILRELPKKGTPCELKISKPLIGDPGRGTGDVIASKSLQIRDEPTPLTLSPPKSEEPEVIEPPPPPPPPKCRQSPKAPTECVGESLPVTPKRQLQCKVLTDQVRVSPIVSCNGVVLEVDVEVTVPESGEKKKVHLEIECPNFVPARIKIGNKWKKIVE